MAGFPPSLMNEAPPFNAPVEVTGEANWLELVRQQVRSLRYGVVQITVHDARVTQIEKTERVRVARTPARPES